MVDHLGILSVGWTALSGAGACERVPRCVAEAPRSHLGQSSRLEAAKTVRWDWEMFGVGDTLRMKEIEENRRIVIGWDSDHTSVGWNFEPRGQDRTLVNISTWGFRGNDDEVLVQAIDSKGGYTMVLAGLKAWLEYGVELNPVRDQFPDGNPT